MENPKDQSGLLRKLYIGLGAAVLVLIIAVGYAISLGSGGKTDLKTDAQPSATDPAAEVSDSESETADPDSLDSNSDSYEPDPVTSVTERTHASMTHIS